MKLESIEELLATLCEYNTVKIVQTFSKGDKDWITARCIPATDILELTFLQEERVARYESVAEAAKEIELQITCPAPS